MRRTNLPRGVIKSSPDKFMVQEIVTNGGGKPFVVPFCRKSNIRGKNHDAPVTLFELTKSGWAHESAIRLVANHLNVELSAISGHGMKDRHALTSQRLGVAGEFAPQFDHDTMWLRQVGSAPKALRRGGNAGNRFHIFVASDARKIDHELLAEVPNYFGVQRIGSKWECEIGKMLLEGDYIAAAQRLAALVMPAAKVYRNAMASTKNWKSAWLHTSMQFQFDFLVQKWQSFLWNKLLEECLTLMLPEALPMWSPEWSELYSGLWSPGVLDAEALARLRSFERSTIIKPGNMMFRREPHGWWFEFNLQPGAYATVVLGRVFDLAEPARG